MPRARCNTHHTEAERTDGAGGQQPIGRGAREHRHRRRREQLAVRLGGQQRRGAARGGRGLGPRGAAGEMQAHRDPGAVGDNHVWGQVQHLASLERRRRHLQVGARVSSRMHKTMSQNRSTFGEQVDGSAACARAVDGEPAAMCSTALSESRWHAQAEQGARGAPAGTILQRRDTITKHQFAPAGGPQRPARRRARERGH